ncbi:tetratricopeptide repeat protein [Pseudoxanthomonas sp. 10H]|uniref:tetratricopeptide repeat protein n=1 Tax=Pseudoxanthomonas sp. 10H TaxID=3242729 RepID=UPI003556DF8F
MAPWLQRSLPLLVLAALVVLAYGGVIHNGYVWDDRYFLLDFAWFDSAGSAVRTAFSPLFQNQSYVRPIPLLTLFAEGMLAGRNPAVSHAVNVLIHLACAFLVFLLARDALRRTGRAEATARWSALALAAFFAVHPALSEAVIWVSSRFDLVATLFMLLGLWVATRERWPAWAVAGGVAGCFLLAALSKESAVVFPFLLLALLALRNSAAADGRRLFDVLLSPRWLGVMAAGAAVGVVYLVIRHAILGGFGTHGSVDLGVDENLARVMVVLPKYLQFTLLPLVGNSPQHIFSWTAESSLFDFILPMALTVALLVTAVLLSIRGKPAGWLLLAWIICYLPVMHLVPLNIGNNSIQQRFMYLPTAVVLALLPYVVPPLRLSAAARRVLPLLVVGLLLACVLVVRSIVPAWRTDLTLWLWADQMAPRSFMVRENLIWAYLDLRRFDKVDEEVLRLREDGILTSVNALVNVGVSHYMRGDFEKAIGYYEQALHNTTPEDRSGSLYINLAVSYAMVGRDDEARAMIATAIRANDRSHVAIGDLLAFCDGQEVDTRRFGAIELDRAEAAGVDQLAGAERQQGADRHVAAGVGADRRGDHRARRVGAIELERAESTRATMVGLLRDRRPSGRWPQLCPDPAALASEPLVPFQP